MNGYSQQQRNSNTGFFIESKINLSDHIAVRWLVVLGGAEADQALLEHEYPEWVARRHQHVDTQIELVSVNDERLRRKWGRCLHSPGGFRTDCAVQQMLTLET